ncbi:DUF4003 family protein [Cytobacillus sp. FJAT-54145]|uniref:DUF4003 family protein n=1 Tax=Cytobacillus spartinae TaxID=3299023 RepID=A0ABW6KAS5_9BACI
MIKNVTQTKIDQYNNIYSQLYAALKWKADKRNLMMVAAMYVTSKTEFNLERFLKVADYIKDEVGFFSTLKSAQRFTTAATLETTTTVPTDSFQHYLSIYEELIDNGFSRTPFSYIAAGTLLKVNPNRMDEVAQKVSDIYKGMKDKHFFLTNSGDYPLAALLAQREESTEMVMKNVEENYQALNDVGFAKGNDLQFLSHILAIDTTHEPVVKAKQCLTVLEQLERANFKTKRSYYPYIGMLSFIEDMNGKMDELTVIFNELNQLHKWNKDINFMMSVLFLMDDISTLGDAAKTGLNITIEALLQAQQAAMTSSIVAASVATSSGGGE